MYICSTEYSGIHMHTRVHACTHTCTNVHMHAQMHQKLSFNLILSSQDHTLIILKVLQHPLQGLKCGP